jgi:hypothetical protein
MFSLTQVNFTRLGDAAERGSHYTLPVFVIKVLVKALGCRSFSIESPYICFKCSFADILVCALSRELIKMTNMRYCHFSEQ